MVLDGVADSVLTWPLTSTPHCSSSDRQSKPELPGATVAKPFVECLQRSDIVVEHRRVDVEACDTLAVLGPRRPRAFDEQDRRPRLRCQLLWHPAHVSEVRLALGLIDEPDIELPVVIRR